MEILRKLRRWCPQPKTLVPANFARLSAPIFAVALIAEILILLIVPIAYYALFVPKNIVVTDQVLPDETLPLTNSQIKAAWPNLPTAQEIVNRSYGNSSYGYSSIDSSMLGFDNVKNYTWISPVNAIPRNYPSPTPMFVTRLVPVEYFIYEKLNDTTWVFADSEYLAATTNHPPYSLPSPLYYTYTKEVGFLGTGLPTDYVLAAVIAIAATVTTGSTYLILHKKKVCS
jgi:hypothetical protein